MKGQTQGHSGFEALYLVNEPSYGPYYHYMVIGNIYRESNGSITFDIE